MAMTTSVFVTGIVLIAIALSAAMAVAWMVQQRTGNSGWIDTVWTFGLGTVAVTSALIPLHADGDPWRRWIVAAFFVIWAMRLGLHIAHRSAAIADDPRYAELVRGWGPAAPSEMFWLLQKQALVSIPLAVSAWLAAHNPAPPGILDAIAVAVMIIAVVGEAVADGQLRRFKADPANKARVCDVGLWRYSRHPNYFFEWLGWLAFPLLAIDMSGGYPWGWVAIAAPVCMYWLLVYVSGIPPLEQHMLRSRGDAYRAYQARTSAFFPAPAGANRRHP